ncbi:Hypothetical protein NTJ_04476 [Nesidiocoris tenuis]|uniref:Uncharacterized protein n=1 Tax=Nesidiocoris tenuis TaxID=355587 RepID=A0ABN7AHZ0_9HEMI|nr:Hypothetical protein NTJ_04476 [Nesidiocoris tenuis]
MMCEPSWQVQLESFTRTVGKRLYETGVKRKRIFTGVQIYYAVDEDYLRPIFNAIERTTRQGESAKMAQPRKQGESSPTTQPELWLGLPHPQYGTLLHKHVKHDVQEW